MIAPADANIGLRGGGEAKVAFIDCDENKIRGTFENAKKWMEGLGFKSGYYPVVKSASGLGRHIYISLNGFIPGDYRKLSRDFGAGEFRYGQGAYVVAPPSEVNHQRYSLIAGDFQHLPKIDFRDVLKILENKDTFEVPSRAPISRWAKLILEGKFVGDFQSRSEREQSLIVSLINTGHKFNRFFK